MGKRRHHFALRIDLHLFRECQTQQFKRQISMNLLLNEMILFASQNRTFEAFMDRQYPQIQKGHYIYIREGK